MATLQKIRSKGPLLIIIIGLALFAFIAGDAFRIFQSPPSQEVGEVNGKSLSAQEYQQMVDEYSEVWKNTRGLNTLNEEHLNQIRDEVWRSYVNNKLIEDEANKIGLVVSKDEIQSLIDMGTHPLLRSTPFSDPQTGILDRDMLMKFLVDVDKMTPQNTPLQTYEYYNGLHKFWLFIERNLYQTRLAEKYQALLAKSITSNQVEAQTSFDARTNQTDLVIAAVPYTSVPDSSITVKMSEVKDLYNKKKEQYRQYVETRDIKYIDVHVTPSVEDREALEADMNNYSNQLREANEDYASIVRYADSEVPYVDLFYTKDAFPPDVIARLDSVAVGEVYGPYFNLADNTLNSFKKVDRIVAPDSIQFRQISVYEPDITRTRTLADSIYTALKGGAKFEDIATLYGQMGDPIWISSEQYENSQLDSDNLKYIASITGSKKNDLVNMELGVANVIYQIVDTKANTDKYKLAVVRRTIQFSNETYNRTFNDFSQFIAANPTLEQISANAEEAGYRLLDNPGLSSGQHNIGGIRSSKQVVRWAFSAKPGDISPLYEVGENDRLLVVALEKVHKEGYRPLEEVQMELRSEVVREKKAEKIISQMKALNATSFDQYTSMNEALTDTVKYVNFSAPAYVSILRRSEPMVNAYASVAPLNQMSQPTKGEGGVMVMQAYNKETTTDTFSEEQEKDMLENTHMRSISNLMLLDLYNKGNVKDTRYIFF